MMIIRIDDDGRRLKRPASYNADDRDIIAEREETAEQPDPHDDDDG